MTQINNVSSMPYNRPLARDKEGNVYPIRFDVTNADSYVKTPPAVTTPQPTQEQLRQQQLARQRLLQALQNQQKKQNDKKINWMTVLQYATGIASIIFVIAFLRQMAKTGADGLPINKEAIRTIGYDVSKEKGFKDLILPNELQKVVEDLKVKIERATALKEKGLDGGNGIMLYGEPGGGKNTFVYALTKFYQELFPGSELIMVDVNRFKGMFNGQTENNIIGFIDNLKLLSAQNPNRKLVVFLDEFDSIARIATGSNAGSSESFQNAFKATLEQILNIENVQVIAATNKAAKGVSIETYLDSAIVNRFAEKIHIPLPTKEQIKASLLEHFKKLPEKVVDKELTVDSEKIDKICEYIVAPSHKASYRDFNYILNHAKVISESGTRPKGSPITVQDLTDAVIKHSINSNWDESLLQRFINPISESAEEVVTKAPSKLSQSKS